MSAFTQSDSLIIRQRHEVLEIFTDFESANKYEIHGENGQIEGFILEKSGGLFDFLKKSFLKSHRPFEIEVFDKNHQRILTLTRPFFFFFSTLTVLNSMGQQIGMVKRRFAIFRKRYDFIDSNQQIFAQIEAAFWRIWKFPIVTRTGQEAGAIVKKWRGMDVGGILTEMYTDADTFLVQFGRHPWTEEQRLIILSAAISVDFDFFENNENR